VTPICVASSVRAVFLRRTRWQQHLPVIASFDEIVESIPGVGREKCGDIGQDLLFYYRFGDDHELVVVAGNVEMLHVVALVSR